MGVARFEALLAGLWAGVLVCIAFIATPAVFATVGQADAGKVVGRVFLQEAYLSLILAVLIVTLERRRQRDVPVTGRGSVLTAEVMLALGAAFCTVAGYFAVQPLMPAARLGEGVLSFGALHAVSLGFFGVKGMLVLALAWRLGGSSAAAVTRPATS